MFKRQYLCNDCGISFNEFVDRRSAPVLVACPECEGDAPHDEAGEKALGDERIAAMIESGKPPGVLTNKTKAVKIAQDIAERDYGMTDMRSGSRPGDIAALAPSPIQTAEAESITRAFVEAGAPAEIAPELKKQAENFWQPAAGAAGTAMQAASAGAAEARKMGSDPVGLLHAAGKKGMLGPKYDVIARDTIKPK